MTKTKQPRSKQDRQWAEAKRRCRLNLEAIRMAKAVGLHPRSLIKNLPTSNQQWTLPVKQWIDELYKKKIGRFAIFRKDAILYTNLQQCREY